MGNIAESVLAKLKNRAREEEISLQQLINLFCQEEFIRRLADSSYKDNLVLKGGYLLYSISGFTTRATVDADYLLKNYSNDIDAIEKLVNEIISSDNKNNFIELKIRKLEIIGEVNEYPGIRANLLGIIGRTRTPFSIDFGVGDIVVPSPVKRILPVLISGFKEPQILTYSLESTIAEKLDAIMSLMETTGRMKDFYDIYYLATTFDFEGRKLQKAIYETLNNRDRKYGKDSVLNILRLIDNKDVLKRWNNFCNKILKYKLDFTDVANIIIIFIQPPYQSMIKEDEFVKKWNYEDRKYIWSRIGF